MWNVNVRNYAISIGNVVNQISIAQSMCLRSLLSSIPCVLTCSRPNVPCVLKCSPANVPSLFLCSCAYVLMWQRALRAYILTCQHALRAYVLTCQCALVLTRSRANVPCVLTYSCVNVPYSITLIHLSFTRKNICTLIGWEECSVGRICTLFSIFVLFY